MNEEYGPSWHHAIVRVHPSGDVHFDAAPGFDCPSGKDDPNEHVDAVRNYIITLRARVEELEKQRELILQEARIWAGEAKCHRATVNEVGSALGGVPNWGPIAKGVRAKLAENERLKEFVEMVATHPTEIGCDRVDSARGDGEYRCEADVGLCFTEWCPRCTARAFVGQARAALEEPSRAPTVRSEGTEPDGLDGPQVIMMSGGENDE